MSNWTLFGDSSSQKPAGDQFERLRVLITVKAAPNPSAAHGETVCVAGVSAKPDAPGWIRLYPVNFRHLEEGNRFRKYSIVEVDARPAREDSRIESWKPRVDSLTTIAFLRPWAPREPWLNPYIDSSMCETLAAVDRNPTAASLALVRVRELLKLEFEEHPGWTRDEQAKIDGYVAQLGLFGERASTPLEAPRLKGFYRWKCEYQGCKGHRQGVLDWEFVALQRRLPHATTEVLKSALTEHFASIPLRKTKNLSFFVGNQAKRHKVFSVLGVYYPS